MNEDTIESYGLKASFGFEADKKSFVAMDTVQSQLAGIEEAINDASSAVKNSGLSGDIGKIASHISKQMRPLKSEFRALRAEMRNLDFGDLNDDRQFKSASKAVDGYVKSLKHLEAQIHGTSSEEREFIAALRQQERLANNRIAMNVAQREATKKASEIGEYKFVEQAGRLIVNQSAIGATKDAIGIYANFADTMSSVASKVGDTGKGFDELRNKALKMGATTRFTAKEAAQAEDALAMAGFKTQEILVGLPATLNLASAGALDLGKAADISSNILSGFTMKANQLNHATDVLAKTATSANTNVQELGVAMSYAAPNAALFRASLEETAAAVGIMSNAGVKADKAGTAMRGVFLRLANPPKKAKASLDEFGISVVDSAGNMRDIIDVLDDIGKKLQIGPDQARKLAQSTEEEIAAIVSQSQQLTAAQNIFGTTAISGASALLSDMRGFKKITLADIGSSTNTDVLKQVFIAQGMAIGEGQDIYDALLDQTQENFQKAKTILNEATGAVMSANVRGLDSKSYGILQAFLEGKGFKANKGEDIFSAVNRNIPDTQKAISTINSAMQELDMQFKVEGSAAKTMAGIMEGNLAGSFRSFGSAMESVKINFIDPIIPAIRLVIDTATKFLLLISNLPQPIRAAITVTTGLIVGMGALAIAVGTVGATLTAFRQALLVTELAEKSMATGLIPLTGFFATSLKAYEDTNPAVNVAKTLRIGFGNLKTPINEARIAMIGFGKASLAFAVSPLGLSIVALTGLYVLLEQATPQVSLLGTAIASLGSPFAFVFGLMRGILGETWQFLAEITGFGSGVVSEPFLQIAKSIKSAFEYLSIFVDKGEKIGQTLVKVLVSPIRLVILGIKESWETAVTAFKIPLAVIVSLFDIAVDKISSSWQGFISNFGGRLGVIIQPALIVAQGLINALNHNPTIKIPASWKEAVDAMQGYLSGFLRFAIGIGKSISRTMQGIFREIAYEMIPDLIVNIDNTLNSLINSITSIGLVIINSLKQGLNEFVYEIIPDFVANISDSLLPLTNTFGKVWDEIAGKNKGTLKAENNIVPFQPPSGLAMMPVGVLAETVNNVDLKKVNGQMSETVSVMNRLGMAVKEIGKGILIFFAAPIVAFVAALGLATASGLEAGRTIKLIWQDYRTAMFGDDPEERAAAGASAVKRSTEVIVGAIKGVIWIAQQFGKGVSFYFGLVNSLIPAAIDNLDTFGLLVLSLSALPMNLLANLKPVEAIRAASAALGPELTTFGIMIQGHLIKGISLGLPGLVAIAISKGWNKGIETWVSNAITAFPGKVAKLEEKIYSFLSGIPDDLLAPLDSVGVSTEHFRTTVENIHSSLSSFISGPLTDFTNYLIEVGSAANRVGGQIIDMLKPLLDFKIGAFRPLESLLVIGPAFKGIFNILRSESMAGVLNYLVTIGKAIVSVWQLVGNTIFAAYEIMATIPGTIILFILEKTAPAAEAASDAITGLSSQAKSFTEESVALAQRVGSFIYAIAVNLKNRLVTVVSEIPVIGKYLAAGIEGFIKGIKFAIKYGGELLELLNETVDTIARTYFPADFMSNFGKNIALIFTDLAAGITSSARQLGIFGGAVTKIAFNFGDLYKNTIGFKDLTKGITLLDLFYDALFPSQRILSTKLKGLMEARAMIVQSVGGAIGISNPMSNLKGFEAFKKAALYISPLVELFATVTITLFTIRSIIEPLSNDFIKASTNVEVFGYHVNAAGIVLGALVGGFLMLSGLGPIWAGLAAGVTYFASNAYVLMGLRSAIILITDTMLFFTKVAKTGFEIITSVFARAGDIFGTAAKLSIKAILGIVYAAKILLATPILAFILSLAFGWNSSVTLIAGGAGIIISAFIGFTAAIDLGLVALKKLTEAYRFLVKTIGDYIGVQMAKYTKAMINDPIFGIYKQLGLDIFNLIVAIGDATLGRFGRLLWSIGEGIVNTGVNIKNFLVKLTTDIGYILSHPWGSMQTAFATASDFVQKNMKTLLIVFGAIPSAISLIWAVLSNPAKTASGLSSAISGVASNSAAAAATFMEMIGLFAVFGAIIATTVGYYEYAINNFKGIDFVIQKLGEGISWTTELLGNLIGLITKPIAPGFADSMGGFIDGFITNFPYIVLGVVGIGLVLKKVMGSAFDRILNSVISIVGLFGKLITLGWRFGKTVKSAATGMEAQTKYMEVAYSVRSRAKGKNGLGYESDQIEGLRREQIEKSKSIVKMQKMAKVLVDRQRKDEIEKLKQEAEFAKKYNVNATVGTGAKTIDTFQEVEKRAWWGGTRKSTEITEAGMNEVNLRMAGKLKNTKDNVFGNAQLQESIVNKSGASSVWDKYGDPNGNNIDMTKMRDLILSNKVLGAGLSGDDGILKKMLSEFDNAALGKQSVETMIVGSLHLSKKAEEEIRQDPLNYKITGPNTRMIAGVNPLANAEGSYLDEFVKTNSSGELNSKELFDIVNKFSAYKVGDLPNNSEYNTSDIYKDHRKAMSEYTAEVLGYKALSGLDVIKPVLPSAAYLPSQIQDILHAGVMDVPEHKGDAFDYDKSGAYTMTKNKVLSEAGIREDYINKMAADINQARSRDQVNEIINNYVQSILEKQMEYLRKNIAIPSELLDSIKPEIDDNAKKIRIGFFNVIRGALTDFAMNIGKNTNAVAKAVTDIPVIKSYFDAKERAAKLREDQARIAKIAAIKKSGKFGEMEMLSGVKNMSTGVESFLKDLTTTDGGQSNAMSVGQGQRSVSVGGGQTVQNVIDIIARRTAKDADEELRKNKTFYQKIESYVKSSKEAGSPRTIQSWIELMQNTGMNESKFVEQVKGQLQAVLKDETTGKSISNQAATEIASILKKVLVQKEFSSENLLIELTRLAEDRSNPQKDEYKKAFKALKQYAKKSGAENILDVIEKFRYSNKLGNSIEQILSGAGITNNIARQYEAIKVKYRPGIEEFINEGGRSWDDSKAKRMLGKLDPGIQKLIQEKFAGSEIQMISYLKELDNNRLSKGRSKLEVFKKLVNDRLIPEMKDKATIEANYGLELKELSSASLSGDKMKALTKVSEGNLNAPEVQAALKNKSISQSDIFAVLAGVAEKGNINPFQLYDPSLTNKQIRQSRGKRKEFLLNQASQSPELLSLISSMDDEQKTMLLDARLDKLPAEQVKQLTKIFSNKFGSGSLTDVMLDILSPQEMLKTSRSDKILGVFKSIFDNNILEFSRISSYHAEIAKIKNEISFAEQQQAKEESAKIRQGQDARMRGLKAVLTQNKLTREEVNTSLGDLSPVLEQFIQTGEFYREASKEERNKLASILKVKDQKGLEGLQKQLGKYEYTRFETDAKGKTVYSGGKPKTKSETFNLIDPFIKMIQDGSVNANAVPKEQKEAILEVFSKMGINNDMQMTQLLKQLNKDGGLADTLIDFLKTGKFTSGLTADEKDSLVEALQLKTFGELEDVANRRLSFFEKVQYQITNFISNLVDGIQEMDSKILRSLERLKEIPLVGGLFYRVLKPVYSKISAFAKSLSSFLTNMPGFISNQFENLPGLRVFNAAKKEHKKKSSTSLPSLIKEAGYGNLEEFRQEFYSRLRKEGVTDEKYQRKALMAFLEPGEKGAFNTIKADGDLRKNEKNIITAFAGAIERPFGTAMDMLKKNEYTTAAVAPLQIFYLKALPKAVFEIVFHLTKNLALLIPMGITKAIGWTLKQIGFADWFMGNLQKFRRYTNIDFIFLNMGKKVSVAFNKFSANVTDKIATSINNVRSAGYFPKLLKGVERYFTNISNDFTEKANESAYRLMRSPKVQLLRGMLKFLGIYNDQIEVQLSQEHPAKLVVSLVQNIWASITGGLKQADQEVNSSKVSFLSKITSGITSFVKNLWGMITGANRVAKPNPPKPMTKEQELNKLYSQYAIVRQQARERQDPNFVGPSIPAMQGDVPPGVESVEVDTINRRIRELERGSSPQQAAVQPDVKKDSLFKEVIDATKNGIKSNLVKFGAGLISAAEGLEMGIEVSKTKHQVYQIKAGQTRTGQYTYGEEAKNYASDNLEPMKGWYKEYKAVIDVIPVQNRLLAGLLRGAAELPKNFGLAAQKIKNSWWGTIAFFMRKLPNMAITAARVGMELVSRLNHGAADATRFAWQRTIGFFGGNVPRMVEVAKVVGSKIVGFLNHGAADVTADAWEHSQEVVSSEMHQMAETASVVGPQIATSMEQGAKRSISAFSRLRNMIQSVGKAGFAIGGAITAAGFAAQTIAFSLSNLGFISEEQSQALYKLTEVFTILGAVTGILSPILGAIFSTLGAIGSVAGIVITGITGIGGAIFTFLISPVGLAVAGITAGIFLLNTLVKNVFGVDLLQGLVSFLMDGIGSAFKFMADNIPGLALGVWNAIAPLGERIKPVFDFIWKGIQDVFLTPFAPILEKLQPVLDQVTNAFTFAIDKITGAWQGFIDNFGGRLMPIIQPALDIAQGLINALNHNPTEKIPEAWQGAIALMQGYLTDFLKFATGIALALTSAFAAKKMFGMMQSKGMSTAVAHTQKISGGIKSTALYANMFNDIAELTGIDLPDFVEPLIKATTFIGILGDVTETVLPAVGAGFSGLGGVIATVFSGAATAIGSIFPLIGIAIASVAALTLAWNNNLFDIQGKAKIATDFISEAFSNSIAQITLAWQSFVDNFGGKLAHIVQPALDVAQRLINALNHNPTVVIPISWQTAVDNIKGSLNTLPDTGKEVGNKLNSFVSSGVDAAADKIESLKKFFGVTPKDASFVDPVIPTANNIVDARDLRKSSQPGDSDFIGPVMPEPEKRTGFWNNFGKWLGNSSPKTDELSPVLLDFTKQLEMALTIARTNNDAAAISSLEAMQSSSTAKGGMTANDYAKAILTPDYSAGQYLKSSEILVNSGISMQSPLQPGDPGFVGPVMPESEKKTGFWGNIQKFFKSPEKPKVVDEDLVPVLLDFTRQLDIAIKGATYDKDTESIANLKALQSVSGGQLTANEYARLITQPDSGMGKYLKSGQEMVSAIDNPTTIGDIFAQSGRDLRVFFDQVNSDTIKSATNLGLEFQDRWRYLKTNGFMDIGELFEPGTEQVQSGLDMLGGSFKTFAGDAWNSLLKLDFPALGKSITDFGISAWGAIEQIGRGFGSLSLSAIAFGAFSLISLSPVYLILGGIGLAALALATNFLGIRDIVFGVFKVFAGLLRIISAIAGAVRGVYQGIQMIATGVMTLDGNFIKAGIDRIASSVTQGIKEVGKGLQQVWSGIGYIALGVLRSIQGGVTIFANTLLLPFKGLRLAVLGINQAFSSLGTFLVMIITDPIRAWFEFLELLERIGAKAKQVMGSIGGTITKRLGRKVEAQVATQDQQPTAEVKKGLFGGIRQNIANAFSGKKTEQDQSPVSQIPINTSPVESSAIPPIPQQTTNSVGGNSTLRSSGRNAIGGNRFDSDIIQDQASITPSLSDNISQLGFALSGIAPAIAQPLILITSLIQSFSILGTTIFGLFPALQTFITSAYAASGATGLLSIAFSWLTATSSSAWLAVTAGASSLWGFIASAFAAGGVVGVLSASFSALGAAAATAWTIIAGPILPFILGAAAVLASVVAIYVVFKNLFSGVGQFFKSFFDTLFGGIGEVFSGVINSVKQGFNEVVGTFRMIGSLIMKPLQPLFDLFGGNGSDGLLSGAGWLLAQGFIMPFRLLGFLITVVVKGIALIIQGVAVLGGLITAVVLTPFYTISNLIKGVKSLLSGIGWVFTSIFKAIGDRISATVDFLRTVPILGQLIEWVAPKKDNPPGYAKGGPITGPGSSTGDMINIMASRGEYMINAKSARNNYGLLEAINNGEDFPSVTPLPMPVPAMVHPPLKEDYSGISGGVAAMPHIEFNVSFGDIIIQGGSSAEMVNEFFEDIEPKLEQKIREMIGRMLDFMK